jgi:hypothetical protein
MANLFHPSRLLHVYYSCYSSELETVLGCILRPTKAGKEVPPKGATMPYFILCIFFASPMGQETLGILGAISDVVSDMVVDPFMHELLHIIFDLALNHWPTL